MTADETVDPVQYKIREYNTKEGTATTLATPTDPSDVFSSIVIAWDSQLIVSSRNQVCHFLLLYLAQRVYVSTESRVTCLFCVFISSLQLLRYTRDGKEEPTFSSFDSQSDIFTYVYYAECPSNSTSDGGDGDGNGDGGDKNKVFQIRFNKPISG